MEILKLKLNKVPFSRYGSYIGLSKSKENNIYIHSARRLFGEDKVFELNFRVGEKVVIPEIDFQPHRLLFTANKQTALIYIKDADSLVIDSHGLNVSLQLVELPSKNGDVPEKYPLAYGTKVGENHIKLISVNARFCMGIHLFEGDGELKGPMKTNERGETIDQQTFVTLTSIENRILATINIAHTELQVNKYIRPNSTEDLIEIQKDWELFEEKIPAFEIEYNESAKRSWYTLWASTVPKGGNYKYPSIVMSMEFMSSVWTWDHCFNTLAASNYNLQFGLDQFFMPFELQAENGALPDYINPHLEIVWGVTKPPIHGWAFSRLMEKHDLGESTLKKAYKHLELWTNWWMDYNDVDQDGIPDYPMGCDSGWDNSTVFDLGYFIESPDLSAFLILQMKTLSNIAEQLNDLVNAKQWQEKSDGLYQKLIDHSWTSKGFVAKVSHSHDYDEDPTSLITIIPLVLGAILEPEKRQVLIENLRTNYLTDYGLATEKYKGPFYKDDNYWRGAIWAPSTYLIVDGLIRADETELAQSISKRFCDMIAFKAEGDFENFNALTGEGLRASGYTWTSSVNLLLLQFLETKSG